MRRLAFSLPAAFATVANAGTYTLEGSGTLTWSDADFTSRCDRSVWTCNLFPAVGAEADGRLELLLDRGPAPDPGFISFASAVYPTSAFDSQGLRFSYSSLTVNLNAYDVTSGGVLASISEKSVGNLQARPVLSFNAGRAQHIRFVATWDFTPGQGLLPSDDPSCAALDCMQPASDELRLNLTSITVPPVPEPATVGLMLIGLGLLGTGLRRRNA